MQDAGSSRNGSTANVSAAPRIAVTASAESASMRLGDAPDARAERAEFVLDALVPAVEMVNAVDDGLPLADEPGDPEARGGTQVGGHDLGAAQRRNALDDRGVALDLDVGAQALELLHVHHPVLEDRFGDHGCAAGDGH